MKLTNSQRLVKIEALRSRFLSGKITKEAYTSSLNKHLSELRKQITPPLLDISKQ